MIAHRPVAVVIERAAAGFALHQRPAPGIRPGAIRPRRVHFPRALDQLIERLWILRPGGGEVVLDLRGELRIADGVVELTLRRDQPRREADVDEGCAGASHRVERRLHHPINVRVVAHEVARHADARAPQRVGVEVFRVVGLEAAFALLRGRVRRIDAGHHAERRGDVRHASRHRPAGVEAQAERDDAVAAQEPVRRLQAGDAVGSGGSANRSTRVGAEADGGIRRRNRGAGAAR